MTRWFLVFFCFCFGGFLLAADWHIDTEKGDDKNSGAKDAPLLTIQVAVNRCGEGDAIFLHPKNGVFRQSVSIRGKSNFMIEGNGCTLDGSDPLPADGWEKIEPDLFRRKLPRTTWDRHLLIIDGRMERMNRTQSSSSPGFPVLEKLKKGEFRFENIDEEDGWLYVKGSVEKLEWSTRPNGIATSGTMEGVAVKNLKARYFLNDGFNVHGNARKLRFENVDGYDCFDEGFSAHDTCEAVIVNGRFWGNENGIADVNAAETIYRGCEFRDNVNTDVLLWGLAHAMEDCRIVNTTTASALVAGPRTEDQSFELQLSKVTVITEGKAERARVRINGGKLVILDSEFDQIDFNIIGAELEASGLKVNGDVFQP